MRNGVLWFFRAVTGSADPDDGNGTYPTGSGSSPDPSEGIRSLPIACIDYAFYILAETSLAMTEPTGYHQVFRADLTGGPILSTEIALAIGQTRRAIVRHDAGNFVANVRQYVATSALVRSGPLPVPFDALSDPVRGTIPTATLGAGASAEDWTAAEDFVLTFAIVAVLAGDFRSVDAIAEAGLEATELEALRPLFHRMLGGTAEPTSEREGLASAISTMRADLRGNPTALLWCGIWLLLHLRWTAMRELTEGPVVSWIFNGWSHLVTKGRFRLASPSMSVPPVEAVLDRPARTPAAAARLILAAAPAAASRIPVVVSMLLETIAASDAPPVPGKD